MEGDGCTLSLIFFDLAIEPVAIALHTNKDVSGIWRGNAHFKVSLYADDLVLFISNLTVSLPPALLLLNWFSKFSGYKLNPNKNELLITRHDRERLRSFLIWISQLPGRTKRLIQRELNHVK